MRDGAGSPVAVQVNVIVLPCTAIMEVSRAVTMGATVCVCERGRGGGKEIRGKSGCGDGGGSNMCKLMAIAGVNFKQLPSDVYCPLIYLLSLI